MTDKKLPPVVQGLSANSNNAELAVIKAELEHQIKMRESCQLQINVRLASIESQIQEIIKSMNNRLPLWATTLIGVLMATIGYLAR